MFRNILIAALAASFVTGCATQTLPGKVVVVERVDGARFGDAITTGGLVGGGVAAGTAAGGASFPSAMRSGAVAGIVGGVAEAIMDRNKTVTVYMKRDGARSYFKQKQTSEISRLQPGDKAVFELDEEGDLVLVPIKQ